MAVFVWRALVYGMTGAMLGLGLAFATSRAMGSLMYGVSSHDVPSFVGATMLLLGIVVFASYLAARRATSVDAILALRCE